MTEVQHLPWHKSSYSNGSGGNCLEIADTASRRLVRDSKVPAGPILRFGSDAWASFVTSVQRDDLG
jgi:hypothetical protein